MNTFEDIVKKQTPAELIGALIVHENGFPAPAVVLNGVVFIWATWSGPSLASYRNLVSVLGRNFADYSLHVVNADNVNYVDFQDQYGKLESSGGYGESFWIKRGSVIYQQPSCCMNECWPEIEQAHARLVSS